MKSAAPNLPTLRLEGRLQNEADTGLLDVATAEPANTAPPVPPVAWASCPEAGQQEGTRVREGLRRGVTTALIALGQGFVQHPTNAVLRRKLLPVGLERADCFAQASCPKWLTGWPDLCRATDERTVIASVLPMAAVNHEAPAGFAAKASAPALDAAPPGTVATLVLDYTARQESGGTSMPSCHREQLPVLPPDRCSKADQSFGVTRILEPTDTAHDMAPRARALGHDGPPLRFDPDRRAERCVELDACHARLYGRTRGELRRILDPADVMGADYPTETLRVPEASEQRAFGECRTRRLALQALLARDRLHEVGSHSC